MSLRQHAAHRINIQPRAPITKQQAPRGRVEFGNLKQLRHGLGKEKRLPKQALAHGKLCLAAAIESGKEVAQPLLAVGIVSQLRLR